MRNLGIRHQSLANFAGAMNILAPMNENSYHDHVAVVCNAADNQEKQSMENAVSKRKNFMRQKIMSSTILQYREMEHGGKEDTQKHMGLSQHCQL